MADQLIFALVGYGSIGKKHADVIKQLGILKAIADPHISANEQLYLQKNGITLYNNIEELLKEEQILDAISICTPSGLHFEQCKVALQNKKHVLCEKPLTLKETECTELIELSRTHGCVLMEVMQNRFYNHIQSVKDIIETKKLGKIFSIHTNCIWQRNSNYYYNKWQSETEINGGVLYTQFSHFTDLLIWLFGPIAYHKSVSANLNHGFIKKFKDTIITSLRFKSGPLCSIHATVNAPQGNYEGSILIVGEKGIVKINGTYLNEMTVEQTIDSALEKTTKESQKGNNHRNQYIHFIDAVSKREIQNDELKFTKENIRFIEDVYKTIESQEEEE